MRKSGKVLAVLMSLLMSCSLIATPSFAASTPNCDETASEKYVEAMGTGVNLGNSFDSFDRVNHQEIDDETTWGNPVVTREYINSLRQKGFRSIRIPFTSFTRTDGNYKINEAFLQRYENVVKYALDAGFYVMINLHHDSSEWLNTWDGNTSSEQYTRFVALWKQLADRFKNYGNHLMFESINEVCFKSVDGNNDKENEYVGKINKAFYDVVRSSGGNNATRMLVLPTAYTNHSLVYSKYLANFIKSLNDKNVMATVHYYSTQFYAFTCNIGVSEFDEQLKGSTARQTVDDFYNCLQQAFVANGIGVVVGEYGLFNMGYNKGLPTSLEDGEAAKFIEYMNYKANQLGICTMLWDNGGVMNRSTGEFYNSTYGNMVKASMNGRSSYATGVDQLFVTKDNASANISVPLTLNGNTLKNIYNGSAKLVKGRDYTYANNTVTLLGSYVSSLIKGGYGVKADLKFVFSSGANWHEYINYEGTASFGSVNAAVRKDDGTLAKYDTDGTPTYPTTLIPAQFNGKIVRRIASYDASGNPKSANTWASDYMQTGSEFIADYASNQLALMNWYNNAVPDGIYTLVIDFYDGTTVKYSITKLNNNISGQQLAG